MPLRRDKDDGRKAKAPKVEKGGERHTPNLVPSEPTFAVGGAGAPPKPKRRLFGKRTEPAQPAGPLGPQPPRLEDVPGNEPWAARENQPKPERRALVMPWAPKPQAGAPSAAPSAAPGDDLEDDEEPLPRPRPTAVHSAPVADASLHEVEFVFSEREAAVPRIKPSGGPGGRISRPTAIMVAVLLLLVAGVVAYAFLWPDDDEPIASPSPAASVAGSPQATGATSAPTAAPVTLPEECLNSFLFADANRGDPDNLTRTADLCPTVTQWLEAARRFPGAVGSERATDVGEDDVRRVCSATPSSAMCRDAERQGTLAEGSPSPTAQPSPAASPGSTGSV